MGILALLLKRKTMAIKKEVMACEDKKIRKSNALFMHEMMAEVTKWLHISSTWKPSAFRTRDNMKPTLSLSLSLGHTHTHSLLSFLSFMFVSFQFCNP